MGNFIGIAISFGLVLLYAAACSDADASSESVPVSEEKTKCEIKLSKPAYFVGEQCPQGDYLLQGIQAVTQNGQTVRGVRCVKIEHSCKP